MKDETYSFGTIKANPRILVFTTIDPMDNKHLLRLERKELDFKLSGCGSSLRNWQFKYDIYEIEFAADDDRWDYVINMINSGTENIIKVVTRC